MQSRVYNRVTVKKKSYTYEADNIVVEYDAARCIHVGECVRGLPAVFDPKRRPWIDPSAASPDAVAEVVRRCPTGALRYRRETGEAEAPAPTCRVQTVPDGPLYANGSLKITLADGQTRHEMRVALCRCGASDNKPYCDGAHARHGFKAE